MSQEQIEKAKEKFGVILAEQLARIEKMKKGDDWTDYAKLKPIKIGICFGDGIGEVETVEVSDMVCETEGDKVLETVTDGLGDGETPFDPVESSQVKS